MKHNRKVQTRSVAKRSFSATSLLLAQSLLALTVAAASFDATADKKAPPKPGWHVCGALGTDEKDAIGETLLNACWDTGKDDLLSGKGGGSFMYCKDGQHTCCESNAAGSVTKCSSVGGKPNARPALKQPAPNQTPLNRTPQTTQAQSQNPAASPPAPMTLPQPPGKK
ncbi:MAG: hypothetical protein EAZ43_07070 [Betaproteobacteria bacterium]|nr:MAG: hypothetical protein EAZ43_07070 [Betaproteobacteria bacterium]